MIDPGVVAVAAVGVTLLLGLLVPILNLIESRAKVRRERTQRRAEAYVELLRLVERRGLAVVDQAFNHTEASWDGQTPVRVRSRKIDLPPRTDRAEARALAAAYGTAAIRRDLNQWITTVDAWESKLVNWEWDFDAMGPEERTAEAAEPEVSDERIARERLGASVSAALDADL